MTKTPLPHYAYILDTIETIRQYTPKTRKVFMADRNAQDATIMRLQDIGEQLVHIRDQSPESWNKYRDGTWYQVIGMRNIISHGYREIDFEIVWDVIDKHLDKFAKTIEKAR